MQSGQDNMVHIIIATGDTSRFDCDCDHEADHVRSVLVTSYLDRCGEFIHSKCKEIYC
jgi:hypothetical protein